jgi:excisionase family DNA binding protein
MQPITFNDIPAVLMELKQDIAFIKSQLQHKKELEDDPLMAIEELLDYLPGFPAKQTIYGWVNNRTIPFEKYGRRLYFRKSLIDKWLKNGRRNG